MDTECLAAISVRLGGDPEGGMGEEPRKREQEASGI